MSNAAYTNKSFVNDDGDSRVKTFDGSHKSVQSSAKPQDSYQTNDDYDPYAHRKVEHPLTDTETFIHLLKCALGTGIFAMPNAFYHSGYVVGLFGTLLLGSIATYCVHMVINIHYDLCKWKKVPSMTYPYVAEAALFAGPKILHRFAPVMIHMINTFIVIYQVGSCCIYVVFISTNIENILKAYNIDIDKRFIMLILLLPLILINWVRNLKRLAPLSTLGNLITIASFAIIWYYIFREKLTLEGRRVAGPLSEFSIFFGTVLFALEAIGVIMPLENEMKTPKNFRGPTGILNRAMAIIIALYIGLGLAGYLKYGAEVKGTVTVNLPNDELLAQVAKGLIAAGIFITHAIACYVAIDIIWREYLSKTMKENWNTLLWEYILRTFIVFVTFILAVLIPDLEKFISLVGALSLSTLGLLFPALLQTTARWNTTTGFAKAFMIFKNSLIGIVGLAGFIIGTTISIKNIINPHEDT